MVVNAAISTATPASLRVAVGLTLLMPWMLLFAKVGAELCTAGIGLLFLWHSWNTHDWAWARTLFMRVALLAWLWLMLIVSPLGLSPERSFFFALPWIRYVLLFTALRHWVLVEPRYNKHLVISIGLMMAYCLVDTLWQYMNGLSFEGYAIANNNRLTGPFRMPKVGIFVARFILPTATLLIALRMTMPLRIKLLTALGALLCINLVLLSGERTAFAATIASIGLVATMLGILERRMLKYLVLSGVVLLLSFALLYDTQSAVRTTLHRTTSHVSNFKESPYGQVFNEALRIGRGHWLTGVGMQGVRELTPMGDVLLDPSSEIHEHFMHSHNPYLEWFAEAGAPGLLLFVGMVTLLVWEALGLRRAGDTDGLVPACMLGACLFHFFPFMSTQSYFSNWTGIMIWYCLGIVFAARNWVTDSTMLRQESAS